MRVRCRGYQAGDCIGALPALPCVGQNSERVGGFRRGSSDPLVSRAEDAARHFPPLSWADFGGLVGKRDHKRKERNAKSVACAVHGQPHHFGQFCPTSPPAQDASLRLVLSRPQTISPSTTSPCAHASPSSAFRPPLTIHISAPQSRFMHAFLHLILHSIHYSVHPTSLSPPTSSTLLSP